MRSIYFILACILFTGCLKANVAPTSVTGSTTSIIKTDTVKTVSYSANADISSPDYWYNGTTGTALIQVTCKDCTAIATIGNTTIPFMFNANGVGVLKYTPAPGLSIQLAVCPGATKAIKAEILNPTNTSVYSYSGVVSANWSGSYISK